jgi:hypothetical protein
MVSNACPGSNRSIPKRDTAGAKSLRLNVMIAVAPPLTAASSTISSFGSRNCGYQMRFARDDGFVFEGKRHRQADFHPAVQRHANDLRRCTLAAPDRRNDNIGIYYPHKPSLTYRMRYVNEGLE